jgi:hypothetical protein
MDAKVYLIDNIIIVIFDDTTIAAPNPGLYLEQGPREVVSLYHTPGNNHGCRGFTVNIVPLDERYGMVISGESCSSCWQVGHDDSSSPIPAGTIVKTPAKFRRIEAWRGSGLGEWERKIVYINGRAQFQRTGKWISNDGFAWGDELPPVWDFAKRQAGYSANELVDDRDDPQPDSTLCLPWDLIIVQQADEHDA